jgi:hypothetical protein
VWAIATRAGIVWPVDARTQVLGGATPLAAAVTGVTPAPRGALWLAVAGGATRLGLLRPGSLQLAPVAPGARRLGATALTLTDAGLWIVDAPSSTLTLLEAR